MKNRGYTRGLLFKAETEHFNLRRSTYRISFLFVCIKFSISCVVRMYARIFHLSSMRPKKSIAACTNTHTQYLLYLFMHERIYVSKTRVCKARNIVHCDE